MSSNSSQNSNKSITESTVAKPVSTTKASYLEVAMANPAQTSPFPSITIATPCEPICHNCATVTVPATINTRPYRPPAFASINPSQSIINIPTQTQSTLGCESHNSPPGLTNCAGMSSSDSSDSDIAILINKQLSKSRDTNSMTDEQKRLLTKINKENDLKKSNRDAEEEIEVDEVLASKRNTKRKPTTNLSSESKTIRTT